MHLDTLGNRPFFGVGSTWEVPLNDSQNIPNLVLLESERGVEFFRLCIDFVLQRVLG